MKNKTLFDKYRDGNHWEKHPTIYADEFIIFLKTKIHPEIFQLDFVISDLGCGIGRDVNHFNKSGIVAIGLDNDCSIIDTAKRNYPKSDFYLCDIHNLPSENNRQWAYYCINVIHYVDASRVLKEIHRTLCPGGYAFIHFNLLIKDNNGHIDYHQKKSDVYELVKKFEIVEEKIFLREDSKPMPHTHHIMQVILKKPLK